MVREQPRLCGITSHQVAAEYDLMVLGQHRESSKIEYLVVQRAKGEAVLHNVRAECLKPLDVRCFQPNGLIE